MSYLNALVIVLVPLIPLFLPGITFVPLKKSKNILLAGVKIMAWSMTIAALGSFSMALLHIPQSIFLIAILIGSLMTMAVRYKVFFTRQHLWRILAIFLPVILVAAILSLPFFLKYDGLPTGDSQKAIYWANQVTDTGSLPNYQQATSQLNRDPVDFFTPALHTLTALNSSFSIQPLTNTGLLAIFVAVAVAWLGAALLKELFEDHSHFIPPLLAAFFILTNIRFLRYIREPGYHYQNLIGEFFLFTLIFFGIRLTKKWSTQDAVLMILTGITLILTHQFSAFLGFFVTLVILISLMIRYQDNLKKYLWRNVTAITPIGIGILIFVIIFLSLGLQHKIPHIFTSEPHLLELTPSIPKLFTLMGTTWFAAGIAGLILIAIQARKTRENRHTIWTFIATTILLLLFSQGPRLFIDIPPVRALFFTVVPLSLTAAYTFARIHHNIKTIKRPTIKALAVTILIIAIVVPAGFGTYTAFASSNRTVRTNSTLGAEQLALIETVRARQLTPTDAILIDDYNRRSTSWFLLSNQPTFARIAANLERQMNEAGQSKARYDLYLKQLDYEKMFSLGSRENIVHLMEKHDIKWLTGTHKASNSSFRHNPALIDVAVGDNTTLYERKQGANCPVNSTCSWYLRTSTLVNDIGDREDTFEHLPASLRTTRLTEPQYDGDQTFRITNAPRIPLKFNIGDYTRILWDKENTGRPDTTVELLIEFAATPSKLTFKTPMNTIHTVVPNAHVRIPAAEVPFDEKGFIEITLLNPDEKPLAIDLIALGLARIP